MDNKEILDLIDKAEKDGRTLLNLSNEGITVLPPEIGRLGNLTELILYNNKLTVLPPEIGRLGNLKELILYNNKLTVLPPEIGRLGNLTWLNLDSNNLTVLPPEIGRLGNLKELWLNKNNLTVLPSEIGSLGELIYLNLVNNQLTVLPSEITNLLELKYLYLGGNSLEVPPPKIVKQGILEIFAYLKKYYADKAIAPRDIKIIEPKPIKPEKIVEKVDKKLPAKKVFISYNHNDIDKVEYIKSIIEVNNIDIIIDIKTLKFGDNIQDFIEKSVKDANFTLSIISENSLLSPWVILETLETFMHEKVKNERKFLPVLIDKFVFNPTIYLKVVDKIEHAITELLDQQVIMTKRFLLTTDFQNQINRFIELRNNIDKVLRRLKEHLSADFTTPEMIAKNLPELIKQIRNSS